MIKDHHESYISWDEFERNQKQLALNNYGRAGGVEPVAVAERSSPES